MNYTEKRKYPKRTDSENLVYYAVSSDDMPLQQGMGRTLNIGQGGVLLETHQEIADTGKVVLSLGLEHKVFEIEARVVRSIMKSSGIFHTGFAFTDDREESLSKIQEYMDLFESKLKNERKF